MCKCRAFKPGIVIYSSPLDLLTEAVHKDGQTRRATTGRVPLRKPSEVFPSANNPSTYDERHFPKYL